MYLHLPDTFKIIPAINNYNQTQLQLDENADEENTEDPDDYLSNILHNEITFVNKDYREPDKLIIGFDFAHCNNIDLATCASKTISFSKQLNPDDFCVVTYEYVVFLATEMIANILQEESA